MEEHSSTPAELQPPPSPPPPPPPPPYVIALQHHSHLRPFLAPYHPALPLHSFHPKQHPHLHHLPQPAQGFQIHLDQLQVQRQQQEEQQRHYYPQRELEHREAISGSVQSCEEHIRLQGGAEQPQSLSDAGEERRGDGDGAQLGGEVSCDDDGGDPVEVQDGGAAPDSGACSIAVLADCGDGLSRVTARETKGLSIMSACSNCSNVAVAGEKKFTIAGILSPILDSMPNYVLAPSTTVQHVTLPAPSLALAVDLTTVHCPLVPSVLHNPFPDTSQAIGIPGSDLSGSVAMEPSSISSRIKSKKKTRKRKLKLVQIQLDPLAHHKLMKLVSEQHEGSLERFVNSVVNANGMPDRPGNKLAIRKPTLTKWKRVQFNQLKGNEMEELALAFRTLAELNSDIDVTPVLMDTPWQQLTMAQLEKMLEETKKLLLSNEKVHDCLHPGCGRHFSTPGNLRDHLNDHSGERPYLCEFEGCISHFPSRQMLCRHMKKHERAHRCSFDGCNKRFAFRERLIVHQKTHCDERPLICPWENCGKSFKWANSLHGHMRTHTGEKPFQCMFSGCGRLFGYKVDLTRHVRTHYGQPARLPH
ncbi:hypothetical protein O6H91_04G001500 [Diphasiastrum complanatum]|uniref:Uncharacterized protein n=1 Tax=Diphasiastrum complanatum TaxID=34168 RepID=A0ACC2DTX9_DIPCM|nr:hypothetical protein O6H91_04G001500 [Diphasiastrum complanatum]